MRSIGIDIGKYSIKVVELDHTTKSTELSSFNEYPLPIGGTSDTYVDIIEILKKILTKFDPNLDRFIVGLPQDMVCTRKVIFPFKEKYKISRSIGFELEDDLPFDTAEAVIHPKIIYTRENSSCILALAALNENIAKILELYQDIGIEPDIVSSDGVALANYFENWSIACPNYSDEQDLPTKAQAYLHLGHARSILAIEMGGHLISLRSIMYGGSDLAQAIAKKYNVTLVEAYKTLKEKSFVLTSQKNASPEQITFSNLLSNNLDSLTSEVKRHMISIEAEEKIHINEVIISGGLAGIKDIAPYFTQGLQVAVNLFSKDFKYMPMLESIPAKKRSAAIIALGLAIEGVKSFKNPAVNFRKEDFAKQSQKMDLFLNKWSYTLSTIGILFLIFCVYSFTSTIITSEISSRSNVKLKQLASSVGLKGRQATTTAINRYIIEKRRDIDTKKLVSELQDINSPLDILVEISKQAPAKQSASLDVLNWQLRGNQVRIEGYVDSPIQLNMVKTALENIASDNKVRIGQPSQNIENKTNFSYSFTTKRNVGEL